ncbi:hypothetical protein PCURB6_25100 [Paenibacillus curdlanolyticus]|nr:hypothetical protein PCURB6_25100 [Paenibacillus curdlanolyticus]
MRDIERYPGAIPAYPIQNSLTRGIRQTASQANDAEYMSLWAGQGLRLAQNISAAEVVNQTIEQAKALVNNSFHCRRI